VTSDPGWQWTIVSMPDVLTYEGASAATAAGGQVHLFAVRRDGKGVCHVAIAMDATATLLADLPLRSVSGAAAGVAGPLVGGARLRDDAPVVCSTELSSGDVTVLELPGYDGPEGGRGLAAWPVPVSGEPPAVVWATGQNPATVLMASVSDDHLTRSADRFATSAVWSLQAVRAPGGNGAVDVLCGTPDGAEFAQLGGDPVQLPLPSFNSGAVLCEGAILAPVDGYRVMVWDTVGLSQREVVLPRAPEGGNARVVAPHFFARPRLLVWETQVPDSDVGPGGESIRLLSSRTWMASVDESWHVGTAVELPTGTTEVVPLDDLVVAAAVTGGCAAWVGRPARDQPPM
jgi:hypothetical protein